MKCFRLYPMGFGFVLVSALSMTNLLSAPPSKGGAQEKKDDQKIQANRQDVNEMEKKLQNDAKAIKAAETEARKLQDVVAESKTALDKTTKQTEEWIAKNIGIPEAIEKQRKAQAAYDEATKPLIDSMRTNPKYAPLAQRVEAAVKTLKELSGRTDLEEAAKQQLQSAANKEIADWRYAQTSFLDSSSELKVPKETLLAAQKHLSELRSQMKKQLDNHPDVRNAEKKWTKAKTDREKAAAEVAALYRKAAIDKNRLLAEKSQLSKSIMQDKANDNKNNKNNNNDKNNNKNKGKK
jgi:hypothetical protein